MEPVLATRVARRWFHTHHDLRSSRMVGTWYYRVCECGAKRVSTPYNPPITPPQPGWPPLDVNPCDSGWVLPAAPHGSAGGTISTLPV